MIAGSNSPPDIWVSRALSFGTIWHMVIVCYLPIASTSHSTSSGSILSKAGHTGPGLNRRLLSLSLNLTYNVLSLGCNMNSAFSGMTPSARHEVWGLITFNQSASWPSGTSVVLTLVYTKAPTPLRQHSQPRPILTSPSWTNRGRILCATLKAIATFVLQIRHLVPRRLPPQQQKAQLRCLRLFLPTVPPT